MTKKTTSRTKPLLTAADLGKIAAMVDVAQLRQLLEEISGETEVTIRGVKHRFLTRGTFTPGAELMVQYLENYYSGLNVPTTRHEFTVKKEKSPTHVLWSNLGVDQFSATNLSAEIVGDVNPHKILLVGSHFDSQASDRFNAEPLAPGADDCGTGTVAAMIIAAILIALKKQGYKLGCTVRFCHFTGEEQSLIGSSRYVKTLPTPAPEIRMMMLEMMGWTSDGSNRVDFIDCGNRTAHAMVNVFVNMVKTLKLPLKPVVFNHKVPSRPSDYVPFDNAGFPAICMSEDSSNEGLNPYMHSIGDTVDKINFDYWADNVRMLVTGIATLADLRKP